MLNIFKQIDSFDELKGRIFEIRTYPISRGRPVIHTGFEIRTYFEILHMFQIG
jgi:hypothetical protein